MEGWIERDRSSSCFFVFFGPVCPELQIAVNADALALTCPAAADPAVADADCDCVWGAGCCRGAGLVLLNLLVKDTVAKHGAKLNGAFPDARLRPPERNEQEREPKLCRLRDMLPARRTVPSHELITCVTKG